MTGLRDAYGTEIAPLPSTFTTAAYVAPVLDVTKLVFGVPDETTGLVTVSAPAGSFPPGTTILIVNSGNGVVLSLTADNGGAVSGELPASIDDRLLVTVADPLGNAVTFERSQYVIDPATGETAVGAGGGVVTSPEAPGFELRVRGGAAGGRAGEAGVRKGSGPRLPAVVAAGAAHGQEGGGRALRGGA